MGASRSREMATAGCPRYSGRDAHVTFTPVRTFVARGSGVCRKRIPLRALEELPGNWRVRNGDGNAVAQWRELLGKKTQIPHLGVRALSHDHLQIRIAVAQMGADAGGQAFGTGAV